MAAPGTAHVVWDWNGTLFDDHRAVIAAVNVVLADADLAPIDSVGYRARFRTPLRGLYEDLFDRAIADRFSLVDGVREWHDGPKGERLVAHLVDLGGPDPADVVLVGDTLDDALAAERVGARIVLYDGGSHHVDHLRGTGHPVAHTLLEALDLAGL